MTSTSGLARRMELVQRREALVRRSDELRLRIAGEARTGLRTPLAIGNALWTGWHWVHSHPWLPVAATAVVLATRQRRVVRWVWRWSWRGLTAWKLWRNWTPAARRSGRVAGRAVRR